MARSPSIALMVNNHMCQALVDTGSVVCLAQSSFVNRLGLKCNHMRNLPTFTGIAQNILPVSGSVYLNVHVGTRVVTHLFSVVPDSYLDIYVLVGADWITQVNDYLEWMYISSKGTKT